MEKKQSNDANNSNDSKKMKKIFGTLQTGEGDDAFRLVGSIVEKGITENNQQSKPFSPIPPPKPSVLPFPVAHHRSHGPHWNPQRSKAGGDDENENYGDEDEDDEFLNADTFAAFAKPVQRKERKGLDFSRWKEQVSGDDAAVTKKMGKSKWASRGAGKQSKNGESVKDDGKKTPSGPSLASVDSAAAMEVDGEQHSKFNDALDKTSESHTDMELDQPKKASDSNYGNIGDDLRSTSVKSTMILESYNNTTNSPASTAIGSRSNTFGNGQVSSSLESEIDAENRARLERMSPEEIAEVQAEIMEKMNPALLKLLKKRGQDRLNRQKNSSSTPSTCSRELENSRRENQSSSIPNNHSCLRQSDNSQMVTSSVPKDTTNRKEDSVRQNSEPARRSLWDAWRERVEAVRDLRFSLDGSVVENDFVPTTETDEKRCNSDSAAERDFLRTEGDPGAAGYTIKEAISLTRSAVPGQRSLALHLLATVLEKALCNICQSQVGSTLSNNFKVTQSTDWEAVWAYALGPEPELVLALRMALDDNHNSVVLACVKVIQAVLSYDRNENFFDISEKIAIYGKDIFTAPVFRSKPEIDSGFLHGGFWKYSAKSSNIVPSHEESMDDETEDKHTIQDDVFVAGQDVAAGLVRMEILPRIYYILETEPTGALEESIISILIALARHSPTCANAIINYPKLVQTVVKRFNSNNSIEICPSQIKSVCLLKVLARFDKKTCIEFVKNGTFRAVTWQLYQYTSSLDSWVKSGWENCKLLSALLVEQLRFWKIYIQNGSCISYFPELFPALCLWLNPPSFEKLVERNLLCEFASVSKEAYLVLEALARTLPNIYSQNLSENQIQDLELDMGTEAWSWSYVGPMVDMGMKWISLTSNLFEWNTRIKSNSASTTSLLWVYSGIIHMISTILEKVTVDENGDNLPWLPEFVPKIGLEIIRNRLLSFSSGNGTKYGKDLSVCSSFAEALCCLRLQSGDESSLASVSCLHGLTRIVCSIEQLIRSAKSRIHAPPSQEFGYSREESKLANGIMKESRVELICLWNVFTELVPADWHMVQAIETFGRGGPAPGVGLGWGASGGGFWSTRVLLAQTDAGFLSHLLNIFQMVCDRDIPKDEEVTIMSRRINSALAVCLIAGPKDSGVVEKALDNMLHVRALKHLDGCVRHFLQSNRGLRSFEWEHEREDYLQISRLLASHFRNRWLSVKRKSKPKDRASKKDNVALATIHEDTETSEVSSQHGYYNSLLVEWAHQRLPLPTHWFLSPISTIGDEKHDQKSSGQILSQKPGNTLEVAKAGLFFLLGIEAMSSFLCRDIPSPVLTVPLIWKLHSLSAVLLVGMDVLEDERTRNFYESLQELYGHFLDEERLNGRLEFLRFKSEIHENYSTFIEALVEQYAAVSYGNLTYGRQVTIYLHRCVEAPVRLATWNVLSNARVLELLPPLEKCLGAAEGYLQPAEDNEAILEAYVKSWASGALDRAATRGSVAFKLVLHHLSCFIFSHQTDDKLYLRNRLVKSLLRDFPRKQHRQGMMLDLLRYNKESAVPMNEENRGWEVREIKKRFEVLKEACEGNSALLSQVEKLKTEISM